MAHKHPTAFVALNIAVLTVSDTRNEATDTSGKYLAESLISSGHHLTEKRIVKDDIYHMRAVVSHWIAAQKCSSYIGHWRHRIYRPRLYARSIDTII